MKNVILESELKVMVKTYPERIKDMHVFFNWNVFKSVCFSLSCFLISLFTKTLVCEPAVQYDGQNLAIRVTHQLSVGLRA